MEPAHPVSADLRGHRLVHQRHRRQDALPPAGAGLFKQEELYLVVYGALLGAVMGTVQLGLLMLGRKG